MAKTVLPVLAGGPPQPTLASQVDGYLHLTCSPDGEGRSRLQSRMFRPPIHISKPYWDGRHLLLHVMSPTAGLLGGDSVAIEARVASGARLALSNPSSLRIHKMGMLQHARLTQRFMVDPGGFLEVNPEWLILQGDSSLAQDTRIELAESAELLFIEAIAPGRIAHGESFRFRCFRNRLRLEYAGVLAACEKHSIEPSRGTDLGWRNESAPRPFYVSVIMASPKLSDSSPLWDRLYELQTDALRIGSSRLAQGPCWSVKLLSATPTEARQALACLRDAFYDLRDESAPQLRRL